MKISIAVPSFNYGLFINSCLRSILYQSYTNYEVLIADGGSSDNSLEIINHYCNIDKRFKLVSHSDNGQADSINKAFSYASGDIFCFLNSDDFYLSYDALESAINVFLNYPTVDIVAFSGLMVSESEKHLRPINLRYHPLDSFGNMKYRTSVLQPATFWKKEVSYKYPFRLDFPFSFDSVFFYFAFHNFSWIEFPKPVAAYRWHGNNLSAELSDRRIYELARFESLKFGNLSFRKFYLIFIAYLFKIIGFFPFASIKLKRLMRILINSISFMVFYRLPSI